MSGRSGNDIASSVVKILEEVVKIYPSVCDITLWSDSCIPQNKNSVMTCALISFLIRNNIRSLTQKFGEPGHSAVQEVDSIHSQIERKLKVKDVFSPVGLVRVLKQVNVKQPFVIIQMREFMDYKAAAKKLNFSSLPFTKVKLIKYIKSESSVKLQIGMTFGQPVVDVVYDTPVRGCRRTLSEQRLAFPEITAVTTATPLSAEKVRDLKEMFKFMDEVDVSYYQTITASNNFFSSMPPALPQVQHVTRNANSKQPEKASKRKRSCSSGRDETAKKKREEASS